MFCLRQQICGNVARVCGLVCQHKDLTRSGDGIDADIAEHSLFCKCDIDVARSDDLVNLRHTLGSERHRSDRLCTADLVDLINASLFCGNEGGWIYLAILSRRGTHDNARNACNLCRENIHKNGGRIYGFAARHVYTGDVKRSNLLSQNDAVLTGKP